MSIADKPKNPVNVASILELQVVTVASVFILVSAIVLLKILMQIRKRFIKSFRPLG